LAQELLIKIIKFPIFLRLFFLFDCDIVSLRFIRDK
jgi:hypothetical protein